MQPPGKEKKPTIMCSSSRRRTLRGSPTSKPGADCTFVEKISNTKTHSTEDVPIRFVSYASNRGGKRQRVPGSKRAKEATNSSRAKADVRLPTVTKNAGKLKPEARLGKRPRVTVGEDVGKKGPIQRTKDWVSVPLNDMEMEMVYSGRDDRNACPEPDPTCVRCSENGTGKSEDDRAVEISEVISNVRQVLKEKGKRGIVDDILPELLKVVGSIDCEVEHMIQNLREGKRAEIVECEANAAAERRKLQVEITELKQTNRTVLAEKLRLKRERDKVQQNYEGLLAEKLLVERMRDDARMSYVVSLSERFRVERERDELEKNYAGSLEMATNSLRLELDRENANQLAKEQAKSLCRICFTAPRDAVVLPCLHFQYCSECLHEYEQRITECPTCRRKISGVLRCMLSTA